MSVQVRDGREVEFKPKETLASVPTELGDFMKFATKCVAPCAVVDEYRRRAANDSRGEPACPSFCEAQGPHAGRQQHCCREATRLPIRSEPLATKVLKELVRNGTRLDTAPMLPFELAEILQFDMMQIETPIPPDNVFGLARVVRFQEMVGDHVQGRNASELLALAKRHPCCFGKKANTLI